MNKPIEAGGAGMTWEPHTSGGLKSATRHLGEPTNGQDGTCVILRVKETLHDTFIGEMVIDFGVSCGVFKLYEQASEHETKDKTEYEARKKLIALYLQGRTL